MAGAPGATTERQKELALAAVEVSPLVRGDAGAVRKFGYEVGRMGDFMPGKTGPEVAGLAMKVRELVGIRRGQAK